MLWRDSGLADVETAGLVSTRYEDFYELWSAFLLGVGAGGPTRSRSPRGAVRAEFSAVGRAAGGFTLEASRAPE